MASERSGRSSLVIAARSPSWCRRREPDAAGRGAVPVAASAWRVESQRSDLPGVVSGNHVFICCSLDGQLPPSFLKSRTLNSSK